MTPGLPGTGIGGLFYVLSALLMPICELWRRWRGEAGGRGALVARQFAIAVGAVAAMSLAFWLLDSLLPANPAGARAAGATLLSWTLPIRVSALLVTSAVLAAVLGAVHLLRLWLRIRAPRTAVR